MNTSGKNCFAGRRKSNSGVKGACLLCWTLVFKKWGITALFLDCSLTDAKMAVRRAAVCHYQVPFKEFIVEHLLLSLSKVFFLNWQKEDPLMRKVVLLTIINYLLSISTLVCFRVAPCLWLGVLNSQCSPGVPAKITGFLRQSLEVMRDQASCVTVR